MENKKMWAGLVRQMLYEIVILALLYLFIGNNFGNNVFSDNWVQKVTDPSSLSFFDSLPPIFTPIVILITVIAIPFVYLIIPLTNLFFTLSIFWMPIFLTLLLCSADIQGSCVRAFWGQYPNIALPKIQGWYKKSKKIYVAFIIVSRIVFVLLLLFKALSAPSDYIADFVLFKWEMGGNLMSILILSVGGVIAIFSTLFSILHYRAPKDLNGCTCPKCHRIAAKTEYKVKIQDEKYDTWETSSGYYSRGTVGEVVDSAGNHIGDVEGDVWVDTSSVRSRKIQPAQYETHVVYKPCGCDVIKE